MNVQSLHFLVSVIKIQPKKTFIERIDRGKRKTSFKKINKIKMTPADLQDLKQSCFKMSNSNKYEIYTWDMLYSPPKPNYHITIEAKRKEEALIYSAFLPCVFLISLQFSVSLHGI